eukprot:PhM_4_TR14162/c0_g1_i1/m.99584/K10994/RAD9A; cell cycle checkpoint control protein RAD9A
MSFTFQLPPAQLRVFARCVTALARIADEVDFEPEPAGLSMRATSSARSTHMHIFLPSHMLESYTVTGRIPVLRLHHRPLLTALRASPIVTTSLCTVSLDPDESKVTLHMYCSRGVTKKFRLHYEETAAQHPSDATWRQCSFTCDGREMVDMIASLKTPLTGRITIAPYASRVNLRTYTLGGGASSSSTASDGTLVDSMLSTDTSTLRNYHLDPTAPPFAKTFEVRGLKTFADLCAYFSLPLTVYAGPGTTPVTAEAVGSDMTPVKVTLFVAAHEPEPAAMVGAETNSTTTGNTTTSASRAAPRPNADTPARTAQSISSFGTGEKQPQQQQQQQ